MVEATLEDPRQVLRAQERRARDRAMAEMKMDGVEYEERLERIADVTYEKPLEDLLDAAFEKYCEGVPWARDFCLRPKSVLRDMLESAADFKGYIQKLGITRYEGALLRYLSEAFRALDRTVPEGKRDERLEDVVSDTLCGQSWAAKASVIFYWSVVPYRAEWRYGPYAHAPLLVDAGHVGENLYLACASQGLGTCGLRAFRHELCCELFGLDGEEEFIVYAAPVGTVRPEDTAQEAAFYQFVKDEDL